MFRLTRLSLAAVGLAAFLTSAVHAQFLSELVGFNGAPLDDEANSQEMFRIPEFSAISQTFIQLNPTGTFDNNAAYRNSTFKTEGAAGMNVFFKWLTPNEPLGNPSWVRLTTFGGALRPNPALHTGGKVRFRVINRSELFFGKIGVCIGVRETGLEVPQLEDGGATGDIEWVGVNNTPNGITAGVDQIVDSTASGDDIQVHPLGTDIAALGLPTGTAVITPGPNGVLNTTPAGDDQIRFGYSLDPNGNRFPIPRIQLNPSASAQTLEFNLANGEVRVNNVVQAGSGVAGFTGDGILNALNNRGTLEHIAIKKIGGETVTLIDIAIDELRFEAPAADPTRPPTVQSPLIAGQTSITVSNIQFAANRVRLYRNGVQIAEQNLATPPANKSFTFNNLPALTTGQTYAATTRNGQNSQESDFSAPVSVLPDPPVYNFSMLLDEGGSGSCTFAAPGWEWVGVSSLRGSFVPVGQAIAPQSGVWQTVDIPLNEPTLVRAGLGGNGALAPSPTGFYTIDSVWFTVENGVEPSSAGPWEVYLDGLQILDGLGQPIETFINAEDGVDRFPTTRGQSSELLDAGGVVNTTSYDGGASHRLQWTYNFDANSPPQFIDLAQTLGVLQRTTGCGTSELIEDTAAGIRFHILARGPRLEPNVPLPVVQAPVVGNQTSIRVEHDATATSLQVYVNGLASGAPIVPVSSPTDIAVALDVGDSVSVTQTLPTRATSDLALPRAAAPPLAPTVNAPILIGATSVSVQNVLNSTFATASEVRVFVDGVLAGAAPGGAATVNVTVASLAANAVVTATQVVNGVESLESRGVVVGTPPSPPTVNIPLEAGDTTVLLTNINPLASLVTVYDGATPIGSIDPAGQTSIDVPVAPLIHLGQIRATASNASGEGAFSPSKEVGKGNGDVRIAIGIRETGTTAGLGENGGSANGIEFVGATAVLPGSTPDGKPLSPLGTWQTYIFDPNVDPIRAFAGSTANGTLSSANGKGTLEMIAIKVDPNTAGRSVGTYVIYVDNVVNVGAGPGGADFVIEDFEAAALGTNEYMFRLPRFSGSTSANLEPAPPAANISQVSDDQANGSAQSCKLSYYYVDTATNRWVRLTTFNAPGGRPNPTIDLTKPVKFDILVLPVLPPAAPTLNTALQQLDTVVTVDDINPDSTLVQVFANGTNLIGSVNPNGNTSVDVNVGPLLALDLITAKQIGPGGTSGSSNAIEVGSRNGDVLVAIGVRETNDAGAIGSPGSTTGEIEFVGAASVVSGAPQGVAVNAVNNWQTLTFDPVAGPVQSFLGDGAITATRGVLEHVAITANAASAGRSSGAYRVYFDNFVNVGAGAGGADAVITNFEGLTLGTEALLQEPTFSGTTDQNLLLAPSDSEATDAFANPGQSAVLFWFFRNTANTTWVRLTTSNATQVPNPIVDLTKPIRFDMLLMVECDVKGDIDGDGDIDGADFNALVNCNDGAGVPIDPACNCADFDDDGRVDLFDIAEFQRLFNP